MGPIYRFSLLVIVLCSFINYCKVEGGYTGFTAPEEDEDVINRLAELYISIDVKGGISFFKFFF